MNTSRSIPLAAVVSVSEAELADFEARVRKALVGADDGGIEILGYGEVSTVLALDSAAGPRACKRLAALPGKSAALAYAEVIRLYIDRLEASGVAVVDTDIRIVEADDGECAVYCIQPSIEAAAFGPNYIRHLDESAALRVFDSILDLLVGAVSETLAPDGQLSNWVFIDGRAYYTDISSPFIRADEGRDLLDWSHLLRALPALLRPPLRRWVMPKLLDKYYTMHGQVLDFLGNLQKEQLEGLIPVFLEHANTKLGFTPKISAEEVSAYYRDDARTYAFLLWARRVDRWWQRRIRRRCYPYFLPPPIERNL